MEYAPLPAIGFTTKNRGWTVISHEERLEDSCMGEVSQTGYVVVAESPPLTLSPRDDRISSNRSSKAAYQEIYDRVEHDGRIHRRADFEALCICVASVGQNQINHESFFK